jgi:hypothetical protein
MVASGSRTIHADTVAADPSLAVPDQLFVAALRAPAKARQKLYRFH